MSHVMMTSHVMLFLVQLLPTVMAPPASPNMNPCNTTRTNILERGDNSSEVACPSDCDKVHGVVALCVQASHVDVIHVTSCLPCPRLLLLDFHVWPPDCHCQLLQSAMMTSRTSVSNVTFVPASCGAIIRQRCGSMPKLPADGVDNITTTNSSNITNNNKSSNITTNNTTNITTMTTTNNSTIMNDRRRKTLTSAPPPRVTYTRRRPGRDASIEITSDYDPVVPEQPSGDVTQGHPSAPGKTSEDREHAAKHGDHQPEDDTMTKLSNKNHHPSVALLIVSGVMTLPFLLAIGWLQTKKCRAESESAGRKRWTPPSPDRLRSSLEYGMEKLRSNTQRIQRFGSSFIWRPGSAGSDVTSTAYDGSVQPPGQGATQADMYQATMTPTAIQPDNADLKGYYHGMASPTSTASTDDYSSPPPTDTPTPVHAPTDTPTPVHAPTDTPTPVHAPTDTPTLVHTPTDTPTPVHAPTDTPTPVHAPTDTPTPVHAPTDTSNPVHTPTPMAIHTVADTPTAAGEASEADHSTTATGTHKPLDVSLATETPVLPVTHPAPPTSRHSATPPISPTATPLSTSDESSTSVTSSDTSVTSSTTSRDLDTMMAAARSPFQLQPMSFNTQPLQRLTPLRVKRPKASISRKCHSNLEMTSCSARTRVRGSVSMPLHTDILPALSPGTIQERTVSAKPHHAPGKASQPFTPIKETSTAGSQRSMSEGPRTTQPLSDKGAVDPCQATTATLIAMSTATTQLLTGTMSDTAPPAAKRRRTDMDGLMAANAGDVKKVQVGTQLPRASLGQNFSDPAAPRVSPVPSDELRLSRSLAPVRRKVTETVPPTMRQQVTETVPPATRQQVTETVPPTKRRQMTETVPLTMRRQVTESSEAKYDLHPTTRDRGLRSNYVASQACPKRGILKYTAQAATLRKRPVTQVDTGTTSTSTHTPGTHTPQTTTTSRPLHPPTVAAVPSTVQSTTPTTSQRNTHVSQLVSLSAKRFDGLVKPMKGILKTAHKTLSAPSGTLGRHGSTRALTAEKDKRSIVNCSQPMSASSNLHHPQQPMDSSSLAKQQQRLDPSDLQQRPVPIPRPRPRRKTDQQSGGIPSVFTGLQNKGRSVGSLPYCQLDGVDDKLPLRPQDADGPSSRPVLDTPTHSADPAHSAFCLYQIKTSNRRVGNLRPAHSEGNLSPCEDSSQRPLPVHPRSKGSWPCVADTHTSGLAAHKARATQSEVVSQEAAAHAQGERPPTGTTDVPNALPDSAEKPHILLWTGHKDKPIVAMPLPFALLHHQANTPRPLPRKSKSGDHSDDILKTWISQPCRANVAPHVTDRSASSPQVSHVSDVPPGNQTRTTTLMPVSPGNPNSIPTHRTAHDVAAVHGMQQADPEHSMELLGERVMPKAPKPGKKRVMLCPEESQVKFFTESRLIGSTDQEVNKEQLRALVARVKKSMMDDNSTRPEDARNVHQAQESHAQRRHSPHTAESEREPWTQQRPTTSHRKQSDQALADLHHIHEDTHGGHPVMPGTSRYAEQQLEPSDRVWEGRHFRTTPHAGAPYEHVTPVPQPHPASAQLPRTPHAEGGMRATAGSSRPASRWMTAAAQGLRQMDQDRRRGSVRTSDREDAFYSSSRKVSNPATLDRPSTAGYQHYGATKYGRDREANDAWVESQEHHSTLPPDHHRTLYHPHHWDRRYLVELQPPPPERPQHIEQQQDRFHMVQQQSRHPQQWDKPQTHPQQWDRPQTHPQQWDRPQTHPKQWDRPEAETQQQTHPQQWDRPRPAQQQQTHLQQWDRPNAAQQQQIHPQQWDRPQTHPQQWDRPEAETQQQQAYLKRWEKLKLAYQQQTYPQQWDRFHAAQQQQTHPQQWDRPEAETQQQQQTHPQQWDRPRPAQQQQTHLQQWDRPHAAQQQTHLQQWDRPHAAQQQQTHLQQWDRFHAVQQQQQTHPQQWDRFHAGQQQTHPQQWDRPHPALQQPTQQWDRPEVETQQRTHGTFRSAPLQPDLERQARHVEFRVSPGSVSEGLIQPGVYPYTIGETSHAGGYHDNSHPDPVPGRHFYTYQDQRRQSRNNSPELPFPHIPGGTPAPDTPMPAEAPTFPSPPGRDRSKRLSLAAGLTELVPVYDK